MVSTAARMVVPVLGQRPEWLTRAHQQAASYCARTGRTRGTSWEAAAGEGHLYVYDSIGVDWWTGGGVTAAKVVEQVDAIKATGARTLNIHVNSPGGDIFEGKTIMAAIQAFPGEKVVRVEGLAASAASLIAMAGDRIITSPAATWMIHEVRGGAWGTAADMLAVAEVLKLENATFANVYAKRTGQPLADVVAMMTAETWMNAETAKKLGFTDEVDASADDGDATTARALERLLAAIQ